VRPTARTHQTEPWAPRQAGPRSLAEAVALGGQHLAQANQPGLEAIPDYIQFVVTDANIPEDAYASYLWLGEMAEDATVAWNDCVHDRTGKLPVRIRPVVLESDEAIVAVIAHEVYEIVALRAAFAERGVLTAREVYEHISPEVPGNLHHQAVAFGDQLVRAMRGE
jgi:hypothetical protein